MCVVLLFNSLRLPPISTLTDPLCPYTTLVRSLSRGSASLEVFEHCERYVVNVLSAGQVALARRFALGHSRERFNGLPRAQAPGGTPMLDTHCAAWFECRNRSRYIEDSHTFRRRRGIEPAQPREPLDRKSTRLNSSH